MEHEIDQLKKLPQEEELVKEQEEKPKVIHLCEGCIFAETYFRGTQEIQTGCKLDRIHKFKKQGVTVDETGNFVKIHTYCRASRRKEWEHSDKPNRVELMRKEIELPIDVVIPAYEEDSWQNTVFSLLKQTLLPHRIILVCPPDVTVVLDRLRFLKKEVGNKCLFTVVKLEDRTEYPEIWHSKTLRYVVKKYVETRYFLSCAQNVQLPKNLLREIDIAYNDNLERFLFLGHDNYAFCSTELFMKGDIDTAIQYAQEVTHEEYLFRNMEDLCPCLKPKK